MTNHKSESRRNKRYVVDGIHGNVLYPSDLEVINISIDGAAIETTKRLELNKEYTLKIKHKDTILNLRGLVVWSILTCREKKGSGEIIPVYRAGLRFTETLSEKANSLINFIEENKTKTLEKRVVGARFKITASEETKIDYPYKYDVKKMSLSGMLVQTEYPLDINSYYNIELYLDENILNIVGRVVNCEKVESYKVTLYNIGIEFMEMSDSDRELLRNFLNSLEEV